MSSSDFSLYPAPEWSSPQAISEALSAVSNAENDKSAMAAYHKLLYAVGNDHSGTYYPIASLVVRELLPLLAGGNTWARLAVLEALVDLSGSFQPEPGFESMKTSNGSSQLTSTALRESIRELSPILCSIQRSNESPANIKELAGEVLNTMEVT